MQFCMVVKHGACNRRDWDFTQDREIRRDQCVDNSSKTEKIYRFDVHAGFEGNYGSVGYGRQCSLVWPCVEER